MMQVEQLQTEIERLSSQDFLRLRQWFAEKDWEQWDQQLEADTVSGKLNFLLDEAKDAKQEGTVKEL